MSQAQVSSQVFANAVAQATAQQAAPVATPAIKADAAKTKKEASKTKTPSKATAKPAKLAIPHGIHDGMRPGAGRLLFAFTHAWLSMSGLASGKAYPKAQAVQVAGATAIAYHTNNGNLALKDGMLTVTPKGDAFFAARSNDKATVEAFIAALKTGKANESIGIKRDDSFKAVKA